MAKQGNIWISSGPFPFIPVAFLNVNEGVSYRNNVVSDRELEIIK